MSQVWGMINGMAMNVYMPLFNVEFPEMSIGLVESLITITSFDIIPWTDDIFAFFLNAPESELEDEKF